MTALLIPRDRSDDLVPAPRRLRRRGDLRRVGFGLLLLTLMVAVHARGAELTWPPYDALLQDVVDAEGLVDYSRLAAHPDRGALQRIPGLKYIDSTLHDGDDVPLARMINTYNAVVLQVLLDAGAGTPDGPQSILDIDGGDVFDTPRIGPPGSEISLNQLEKEHIAKLAGDARYHFAINCGALSCPPLRAEAYTGEKLQQQLDDQRARTLDRGDDRFLVWLGDGKAEVSKIFEWYGEEFGDPAAYLNEHAELPGEVTEVGFLGYDWSLNAQP